MVAVVEAAAVAVEAAAVRAAVVVAVETARPSGERRRLMANRMSSDQSVGAQ